MASQADKEQVVSVLRACLLSNKGGTPLSILNRDYKALNGTPIPFRKLGYSSVEDFLKSTDDIITRPDGKGDIIVQARPSEASAHIASLVSRQRSSQKKRIPVPNICQSRKPTNQSWKPPPSSHKQGPTSRAHLSVTVTNNVNKPSRLVSVKSKSNSGGGDDVNKYKYEVPPRLQKFTSVKDDWSNLTDEFVSRNDCDFSADIDLPEDLEDLNFNNYETNEGYQSGIPQKSKKSITSPFSPRNAVAAGRAKTEDLENFRTVSFEDNEGYQSGMPQKSKKSITSPFSPRNAVAAGRAKTEDNYPDYNMEVAPWNRKKPGTSRVTASENETFILKLHKFSMEKGWPEPSYKILPRHPKNERPTYGCQVEVCYNQRFYSYPDESSFPEEAKEFAAKKAYHQLLENEKNFHMSGLKVTNDEKEIRSRLYKLVENHRNGLWADCIFDLYTNKFNELLPADWLKKAATYPNIHLNTVCGGGKVIVTPNTEPSLEETRTHKVSFQEIVKPAEDRESIIHTQVVPEDNLWDVYVTYVDAGGEVWVRIIGPDYSEKYGNMSAEMELFYGSTKNELKNIQSSPNNLRVNEYYAAQLFDEYSSGDCWHRVCVQEINWESQTADCWLIDNGDSDMLTFKQIYPLMEEFTYIRRQAVLCSLAGLEDYAVDEAMLNLMFNTLVGQVLVAKVIERNETINEYSLILFDTTGEDDINLNQELISRLDIETSKPELPEEQGVKEVYVSHIADGGQLYIQIQSDVFTHLQNLIADLTLETIEKHCFKSFKHLKGDKIYLAKFNKDENWYRAAITRIPSASEKQVEVMFVDYGNIESVDIHQICDLEAISEVLSRIPKQALPIMLHAVEIGPKECSKLKEMISESDPVVLKVITSGDIPKVEIFKRTTEPEGEGALISINNTIALQRELNRSFQRRHSIRRSKSCSKPITSSVSRPLSPAHSNGDTVHRNLSPPAIPDIGADYFDIFVTMAANPSNFIVQPLENINSLKQLLANMKSYYSYDDMDNVVGADNLVEGGLYAALFENNEWYRVTLSSGLSQDVTVHSCDFGEYTSVSPDKLRYLAPQFTELPYQAIKAKLTGIVPAHRDWTVDDCLRFQDLVVEKQLVSIVMEKGPDLLNPSESVLGLQIIDTTTDEDIIIANLLVEERRAKSVTFTDIEK
ncbi:tudor domain-containing protein 7-like isoform X2 [Lycorma delicatula]|uniref:tudor domain-containing protein 7-like isoform X2 n=1 Tax=Lycorma delicatula TaxID=130591 RepID=UPI003F50E48B